MLVTTHCYFSANLFQKQILRNSPWNEIVIKIAFIKNIVLLFEDTKGLDNISS